MNLSDGNRYVLTECSIATMVYEMKDSGLIEDGALVGTASVVLHDARVQSGALVGANAVVTGGTVVPSGAMALGIPAKIREGLANQDEIRLGVESYVSRAKWFRKELRRID